MAATAAAARDMDEGEDEESAGAAPLLRSPITATFMDDIMTDGGFKEFDAILQYGDQIAYSERQAIPTSFMNVWKRIREQPRLFVNDDALFLFLVHYKHNIPLKREIDRATTQPQRLKIFDAHLSLCTDWFTCGLQPGGKRVPKEIKKKQIPISVQEDGMYAVTAREFAGKMRQLWSTC